MAFDTYDNNNKDELSELDRDTIAVIDGDEFIYGVGFACEERVVQARQKGKEVNKDKPEEGVATFKNKTQMFKFFDGILDKDKVEELFEYETTRKAEPVANALSTMKRTINNVCKRLNAGQFEIYIGGENNFRDKLPLPKKYKDREDALKPLLFQEIKDYLLKYQGAELVTGREADDVITSRMYDGFKSGTKVIGITQDKDATQSSGWLYNAKTPKIEPRYIKGLGEVHMDNSNNVKGTGRKFLYAQMLVGDSVDTYNPRDLVESITGKKPRYGDKTCFNVLDKLNTDKECMQAVVDQYIKWFGKDKFSYTSYQGDLIEGFDWMKALQMYTDCAYMQRYEGDQLKIERLLDKLGVDYA